VRRYEANTRGGTAAASGDIGLKAAQQIASLQKNATIGVVDFDGLPARIAADMREGGPALALSDASILFAKLRAKSDPPEIALATKASVIAHRVLEQAQGDVLNETIASIEREARRLGAEEIYIAVAPDLARGARFTRMEGNAAAGQSYAVRATVAYKDV